MSHWTESKTKIKNLNTLQRAATKLGVNVKVGEGLKLTSRYQEAQDSVMLFDYNGGLAGVIEENGEYSLSIDNFMNPIVEKIGRDCSLLGREYSAMLVADQAYMMGGTITSQNILEDGSVEIMISM